MAASAQQVAAGVGERPRQRLGVVAPAGAVRQRLVTALGAVPQLEVACTTTPERTPTAAGGAPCLAAWVACLPADGSADACLEVLWEQAETPVFVTDALPACEAELRAFCAQVAAKLEALAAPRDEGLAVGLPDAAPVAVPTPPEGVAPLWVLAASLGGPGAVRRFLQALPAAPPVALLLAQHIDAGQEARLARLLCRDTPVQPVACTGAPLPAGALAVVPVSQRLTVGHGGAVAVQEGSWSGPWSPDIGAVVSAVAGVFGPASGAVFFSGMGDDGAAAAAQATQQGLELWAQTPGSAASPVMPAAALSTGACTGSAPPEELARRVMARWRLQAPAQAHGGAR